MRANPTPALPHRRRGQIGGCFGGGWRFGIVFCGRYAGFFYTPTPTLPRFAGEGAMLFAGRAFMPDVLCVGYEWPTYVGGRTLQERGSFG